MNEKPIVGLFPGDVTGIGPEISVKLLARADTHEQARVVVVGDKRVLDLGMADAGLRLNVKVVANLADIDWNDGTIPMIDRADTDPAAFTRGALSADAGRLAGETLGWMTQRVLAGELDEQGDTDRRDQDRQFRPRS